MCIAIPGKVVKFIDFQHQIALVDFMGVTREVNVQLIEDLEIDEYLIVHVGYAIQKIDVEDALDRIKMFFELSDFQIMSGYFEV